MAESEWDERMRDGGYEREDVMGRPSARAECARRWARIGVCRAGDAGMIKGGAGARGARPGGQSGK